MRCAAISAGEKATGLSQAAAASVRAVTAKRQTSSKCGRIVSCDDTGTRGRSILRPMRRLLAVVVAFGCGPSLPGPARVAGGASAPACEPGTLVFSAPYIPTDVVFTPAG